MPVSETCNIWTPIVHGPSTFTSFCIEGFVYVSTSRDSAAEWYMSISGGSDVRFQLIGTDLTCTINGTPTPSYTWTLFDQWVHVACTQDGATTRIFVNGALVISDPLVFSSTTIYQANMSPEASFPLTSTTRIDECRCIVGTPVYTSAFTPPITPFV